MAPSALLVFGDSLSDVGNAFAQRGVDAFPCPPHWQGRRCDGPVWVEGLASGLGLPPLRPSLAGGSDHAFGGARSGEGLSAKGMPNLLEQVIGFLGGVADPAARGFDPAAAGVAAPAAPAKRSALDPAGTLVVLRAGANDYLDAPPAPAVAQAVNAHLLEAVTGLAAAGYRRFLVPSELPWGWAPLDLPGVTEAARLQLNHLIASQNRALAAALRQLAAERGLTVVQPDFEAQLLAVRADPAGHGFADVQRPRLPGDGRQSAAAVPDAAAHLWWDSWGHLTAAFHRLLAQRALEALRDPGAL